MFLFGDTETTGFPKNGYPLQPGQARICQIALILTDENGKSLAEFSSLIKPEGWTVGEDAAKIHGFTTEDCERWGMPKREVMSIYFRLCQKATLRVFHNAAFDDKMLSIEWAHFDNSGIEGAVYFPPTACTMIEATPICQLPSKTGSGYKWPKLEEALNIICNKSLGDTAHDALWDARACREIFFGIQERNKVAA